VSTINGWLRSDGRKGIRNVVVVVYLVECAHHVAREIQLPYREQGVHVIGFSGCFPNAYALRMMKRLCTHPNVGAALLVSLGCESFNRHELAKHVRESGRPIETLVIQERGGTRRTIEEGRRFVAGALETVARVPRAKLPVSELIVGTKCGGSDATSGLTANPSMGRAFDYLIDEGAAGIFEELGELIGLENYMAERAVTPELGREIQSAMAKTVRYYATMGHSSFAVGNAEGGLTTIEEKSLGAYAKSGARPIAGMIKPGDVPPRGGLYLMDMIPDGEARWGFPSINDNSELGELIASGAHMVLFSTGRGSVVGSAVSPIIKVCANPDTYRRLSDDMDVDAGRILGGAASVDDVGCEIADLVKRVAAGEQTKSEALGHQEFVLTYKSFEPIGPSCLPAPR
jgi:altronate dehydratase large subunit